MSANGAMPPSVRCVVESSNGEDSTSTPKARRATSARCREASIPTHFAKPSCFSRSSVNP
jgi:hypothetical protein